MTDEVDNEAVEDGEDDYYPEPTTLSEGECFIYDPMGLCEEYAAIAVQFVGGDLWVMPADSLTWVKVAPPTAEAKPGKPKPLKVVQ